MISEEADCGDCHITSISSPHPAHLPTSPPYCFPLGAWQHPSRWRVYFCFCLFTYSCIQLFGASQGLSFHRRMQIATAANPLSSLPCWHPTSLHVSPSLLQSGHLCYLPSAGAGTQWPGRPSFQLWSLPHTCQIRCGIWPPAQLRDILAALHMLAALPCLLTLAPRRGSLWEESGSYSAIPLGMEGCGSIPNWVREDMSGFGHQVATVKQSR